MKYTVAFVTSQYSGDRLIKAAKEVAVLKESELVIVSIMNNEYSIEPDVVDYLFKKSKEYGAVMKLIFREDTIDVMKEVISEYNCKYVVSGMPSRNNSVLYDLWREFIDKRFFTIDADGNTVEVANTSVVYN